MKKIKFLKKNFARAQLSISEFQEMCRISGYYDITRIASAQLESSGRLSILCKSEVQTVTLADLHITAKEEAFAPISVIYDGKVLDRNLTQLGKNAAWLQKKLKEQQVSQSDVFLATVDGQGNVSCFLSGN